MAENNEDRNTDDLSEEASPYRLEEFRKKGQVSQSKELASILMMVASGVALFFMAPEIAKQLVQFMKETFTTDLVMDRSQSVQDLTSNKLVNVLKIIVAIGLPISLVGFILGIFGHITQIGFLTSTDPLMPNFEKINPLSGLKRLVSMKNLVETARVVIKGIILCFISYTILKSEIINSPRLIFESPASIFEVLGSTGKTLFFWLCGCLAVFAGIDWFLQHRDFGKQVRVTRAEAKQETKENEGDPMIKARIRGIQREMARRRMMAAVKKADVIITNPTHIAIAIKYDRDKMVAPKVVAKGADLLAEKIKKMAQEAGIPLVENVPLARAMFKGVKIGQIIPRNLFQAVAEVLAYVYKLKNRRF